jgi:hypothetical protein
MPSLTSIIRGECGTDITGLFLIIAHGDKKVLRVLSTYAHVSFKKAVISVFHSLGASKLKTTRKNVKKDILGS